MEWLHVYHLGCGPHCSAALAKAGSDMPATSRPRRRAAAAVSPLGIKRVQRTAPAGLAVMLCAVSVLVALCLGDAPVHAESLQPQTIAAAVLHKSSVQFLQSMRYLPQVLLPDSATPAASVGPTAATATATPTATATATATATPTATPTPSPTPLPLALTLVSPASGRGPVGAHVTVKGKHFVGTSAVLCGSVEANCSNQQQALATVQVQGDGTIPGTLLWPTAIKFGTYYICTAGLDSGAPGFQVLSDGPPTLSLSTQTIQLGQQLTINGRNFVGLPSGTQIVLTALDVGGAPTSLPSASVSDNGAFVVTWTTAGSTGTITILASSPQEGAADAVLQARASLVIQA